MNNERFELILHAAVRGEKDALEELLELYMPLIDRYSYVEGRLDEDLRQYLLMHIVKQIRKFKL